MAQAPKAEPSQVSSNARGVQRPEAPRALSKSPYGRSKKSLGYLLSARKETSLDRNARVKSSDFISERKDSSLSDLRLQYLKYSALGGDSVLLCTGELSVITKEMQVEEKEEDANEVTLGKEQGEEEIIVEELLLSEREEPNRLNQKPNSDDIYSNFSITNSYSNFHQGHQQPQKIYREVKGPTNFVPDEKENDNNCEDEEESAGGVDSRGLTDSWNKIKFLDRNLEKNFLESLRASVKSPTFHYCEKKASTERKSVEDLQILKKKKDKIQDSSTLDLVFDEVLDCYYDPVTGIYYNLKS